MSEIGQTAISPRRYVRHYVTGVSPCRSQIVLSQPCRQVPDADAGNAACQCSLCSLSQPKMLIESAAPLSVQRAVTRKLCRSNSDEPNTPQTHPQPATPKRPGLSGRARTQAGQLFGAGPDRRHGCRIPVTTALGSAHLGGFTHRRIRSD